MNYRFEEMTPAEIALLGEALDLLPHGRVAALVRKMQAQISTQDNEAQAKARADQQAAVDDWVAKERTTITKALLADLPKRKKRT